MESGRDLSALELVVRERLDEFDEGGPAVEAASEFVVADALRETVEHGPLERPQPIRTQCAGTRVVVVERAHRAHPGRVGRAATQPGTDLRVVETGCRHP